MVYLDESGIDKFLHRDYARSTRGTQVICDIKGNQYQRVSMISALCMKRIIAPFVFEGTADRALFTQWLEECLAPQLKPDQVVVMDNYSIHKGQKIKDIIENRGCRLVFLPPYSPDLNPIENLWAIIKNRIRKMKKSYSDFHKAIDQAFRYDY